MSRDANQLDRILSKCIRGIEEKGWTVNDCLNRYKSYQDELEPLLRVALQLRQGSKVKIHPSFKSRAKARMHIRIQSSRRSPIVKQKSDSTSKQRSINIFPQRLRLAGALVPILLVVLFIGLGSGVVYASDQARPGEILFPVDRMVEQVRINFMSDLGYTVRLHLEFADERIQEVIELVSRGDSGHLIKALEEYKEQIFAIAPIFSEAQARGIDLGNLTIETNNAITLQKATLQGLIATAPVQYGVAFSSTIEDVEKVRGFVLSPIPLAEPLSTNTPVSIMVFGTPAGRTPTRIYPTSLITFEPAPTTIIKTTPIPPTEGFYLPPPTTPPVLTDPIITEVITNLPPPAQTPTPTSTPPPTNTPRPPREPDPTETETPTPEIPTDTPEPT